MPPTPDGLLKFCRDVSFTNNVHHEASGQTFSIPPPGADQNTWTGDVQQGLKDEISDVMMQIYGKDAEAFEFKSFRICWYTTHLSLRLVDYSCFENMWL
jgi:hypothetical protein